MENKIMNRSGKMVELVNEYRNGNEMAFNELLSMNNKLLNTICNKYRSLADREDLYQVACLGLLKAIKTFDEEKGFQFDTWLNRVSTNEVFMQLRKERRHNSEYDENGNAVRIINSISEYNSNEEDTTIEDTLAGDTNVENEVFENVEKSFLYNMIEQFSGKNERRGIIIRMILKGMTVENISKEVGCVHSTISKTRTKFIQFCKTEALYQHMI